MNSIFSRKSFLFLAILFLVFFASYFFAIQNGYNKEKKEDNIHTDINEPKEKKISKPIGDQQDGSDDLSVINFDDYIWLNQIDKSKYLQVKWTKINSSKLEGFSPDVGLIEKNISGNHPAPSGSYLNSWSGLISWSRGWLEDEFGVRIDSIEKIRERFVPVETEAEAVSFVAIRHMSLPFSSEKNLKGHVLSIDNGFLVDLIGFTSCGQEIGSINRVLANGDIIEIAYQVVFSGYIVYPDGTTIERKSRLGQGICE